LPRLPRGEAGVVLVHVLIMAVLLIILATGVMKIVFSNHVLIAHVKTSDQYRYWVEACQARAMAVWTDTRCTPAVTCDFSADTPPGPSNVTVSCPGTDITDGTQVDIKVTW
ncbi:MAG TPA: hypothetical protein DD417_03780, partial [Elusimicrobia bacterium]|nr:hypothetical protein [Elusimicrobiota bacterium]